MIIKIKKNYKKILSGIALLVGFCLLFLLIVLTRKTNVVANDERKVTLAGKTYDSDHPLTILEIVPDYVYDVLGPAVGYYDSYNQQADQKIITWDKMIAGCPKGKENEQKIKDYLAGTIDLCMQYLNGMIWGSGITAYYEVKGEKTSYTNANSFMWVGEGTGIWAGKGLNYNVTTSDIQMVFYKKNADGTETRLTYSKKNADGTIEEVPVRDIFSYLVFGTTEMEGLTKVKVMTADQVSLADVNSAGLVYINKNLVEGYIDKAYKNLYNYTAQNTQWGKGNGKKDLNATVALNLLIQNVKEGKPIIYSSDDKSFDTNIGTITNFMCGVENDYMIRDFARTRVDDTEYKGKVGGIYADTATDSIQIYTDSKGNNLTKETTMFVKYYNGSGGDIASNYPAYNTTLGAVSQDKLRRNSFEANTPNQLSQLFSNEIANAKKDDYETPGKYYGSYYNDARRLFNSDSLNTSDVIRYIMGIDDNRTLSDIRVLEVEPEGYYKYLMDDTKVSAGSSVTHKEWTESVIKKWFNISTRDEAAGTINISVDHTSMNGFIGMNEDLAGKYDLIIIGTYGADKMNTDVLGGVYSTGKAISAGGTVSGAKLNGNDITQKMYDNLYEYALRGMPLVLDEALYFGDNITSSDSLVQKELQIDGIVKEIIADKGSTRNITWIRSDSGGEELGKSLEYVEKPTNNVVCSSYSDYASTGQAYNGVANSATNTIPVTFKGKLSNDSKEVRKGYKRYYRVKVYLDLNQDGIYSEIKVGDNKELYLCDSSDTRGVNEKYQGAVQSDGTDLSFTINLPASAKGYFAWKTEIVEFDAKEGNDSNGNPYYKSVNTELYAKQIRTGAFAIKGNDATVKVLQITTKSGSGSLDLNSDEFTSKFNEVRSKTGLELQVTKKTQQELNDTFFTTNADADIVYRTGMSSDDISKYMENYSMIILGFQSQDYGLESDLHNDIMAAINKYIDDGHSVMFTYDTMSAKLAAKEYVKDYQLLKPFTKAFETKIGLKENRFSDATILKTARQGSNKIEMLPYALNDVDAPLIEWLYNGTESSYQKGILKNGYIKLTSGDFISNKANELNSGQVTNYPYQITGIDATINGKQYLEGNVITTSENHPQAFALNLEKNSGSKKLYTDTYENGKLTDSTMETQPVVWYTLAKSYDEISDGGYSGRNSDSGKANENIAQNQYYSATDRDAMNNYYLYSYGNVTYTAAGHQAITSEQELELFVNTMTKSILSGKSIPGVTYTDAVFDNADSGYATYIKYNLKRNVQEKNAGFKFRIDFISNYYNITDAKMYIDFNGNGSLDSGEELGYINVTPENTVLLSDSLPASKAAIPVAGMVYTVTDFRTLVESKLSALGYSDSQLLEDMYEGKLNVGIVASSDQIDSDGDYVSGYSIINLQVRELFNLD